MADDLTVSRGPNIIARAWRAMFGERRAPQVMVPQATLGPGGPPVGVQTALSRRQSETHPLIGADVRQVDAALRNAYAGRPSTLMDLFDDMVDRDTRVGPVCRTRTQVIAGRPWSVRPRKGYEDDAELKKIAGNAESLIRRIKTSENGGWRSCIVQAADGVLRGYSVLEKEWATSREGWHYPRRLHWRHPNRFVWDEQIRLCLSEPGRFNGQPLEEMYGPHKFVVHSPMAGRASYPMRRGVMLGMVFPSLTARYGYRWWLKATEKWGSPIPHAKLPKGEGDDKASSALNLIRKMMADWIFVSWGDVELDVLSGTGSLRHEVFESLVANSATTIAIHGLGQNLTTEVQGGSFAAAKVSNLIRLDLLEGDLGEWDDACSAQVLDDILHFNWPGTEGFLEYVTEIEERGEPTVEDVKAGIFSHDERRAALGHGPKPDGSGAQYTVTPTAAPEPPALPPPGGADDADPFELSRVKTPRTAATSPTSERSTSTPARSLYSALAGSGPSPSRPS